MKLLTGRIVVKRNIFIGEPRSGFLHSGSGFLTVCPGMLLLVFVFPITPHYAAPL